jgi:hypothetical protein
VVHGPVRTHFRRRARETSHMRGAAVTPRGFGGVVWRSARPISHVARTAWLSLESSLRCA